MLSNALFPSKATASALNKLFVKRHKGKARFSGAYRAWLLARALGGAFRCFAADAITTSATIITKHPIVSASYQRIHFRRLFFCMSKFCARAERLR
jgi:hypothetical protein